MGVGGTCRLRPFAYSPFHCSRAGGKLSPNGSVMLRDMRQIAYLLVNHRNGTFYVSVTSDLMK
jgi:hypothetical protein